MLAFPPALREASTAKPPAALQLITPEQLPPGQGWGGGCTLPLPGPPQTDHTAPEQELSGRLQAPVITSVLSERCGGGAQAWEAAS